LKNRNKLVGLLLTMMFVCFVVAPPALAATCNVGNTPTLGEITRYMGSSGVFMQNGTYGVAVYELERELAALGYRPGNTDALYTQSTASAVASFQQAQGLPVTGKVDQATWQAIRQAYQAKRSSPSPAPTPSPVPTPTPTPAPAPATGALTTDEQLMFDLVNGERVKAGLAALQVDMRLVQTARLKSQDMIANNYFSHQSPTYGSPFEMMQAAGISYRYAGENLAGASTVELAHRNLMQSPGHRANILNPNYPRIGIGIVDGGPYGKMFTQQFIG
jgi:uncharacterized YkwD family protein